NGGASTTSSTVTFTVGGGGGNTAPVVSQTSPTAGQSFAAGASITLAATATDNVSVQRREVLVDGNIVGTHTPSPYTAARPTPPRRQGGRHGPSRRPATRPSRAAPMPAAPCGAPPRARSRSAWGPATRRRPCR